MRSCDCPPLTCTTGPEPELEAKLFCPVKTWFELRKATVEGNCACGTVPLVNWEALRLVRLVPLMAGNRPVKLAAFKLVKLAPLRAGSVPVKLAAFRLVK